MEVRTPRTNSRLLIDEDPLQVLPSLATSIGLNEAIFLQQIHYWLKTSSHERDGRRWIYNSLDSWRKQFPFFTLSTLRRTIAELRKRGLLLTENYNESKQDRTLWYTIDYDAMEALQLGSPSADSDMPSAQNEQMDLPNMSTPNVQNEQMLIGTEINTETNQRGGVSRERQPAAAGFSETEKRLMVEGGLSSKQARTATRLQTFTPELLDRIKAWADKLRSANKKPGAILCGWTDAGLLPDDLPKPKRREDDFRVYRKDGSVDIAETNRLLKENPGRMLARAG